MHIHFWCTLIALTFVILYLIQSSYALRQLRLPAASRSRRFLLLRSNMINQRACACPTSFSCSCCETVTLSFSKMRKALCSNFMYQRNGMNVDVSLDTDTLRSLTVTNYRPLKVCTAIPGSLFSSICVNILELNEFPRSITVCVRHEILSKFEEWQISYTCVSISTDLPMIAVNASMPSTMMTMSEMSSMMAAESPSMTPQASTMMASTAAAAAAAMTSSAGMMMMMMPPNGMGSSPPPPPPPPGGQMGPMGGGGPPPTGREAGGNEAASGGGSGKRKKRYTRIKHLPNYSKSKIVNEKYSSSRPPLELATTLTAIQRTSVTMPKIPTIVVSSGATVPHMKSSSVFGNISVMYNQGPPGNVQRPQVEDDRAAYFPSRIPPLVAMTLKQDNISYPRPDDIVLFGTNDNDSQLPKNNNMGHLIFPN